MLLIRVFLPFAFGYFLSYVFRTVNAVIAPDLVAATGVSPGDLGLLTSTYFLTFAAFQLPLGVLLDRYGPRLTEAALLLIAALGAALFALADGLPGLMLGRALIGLGVSACLMAAFKAFVLWFPPERLPTINGLQMASGGLGALAATAPVEALMTVTDWRGLFGGMAALCVLASLAILVVVPRRGARPLEHTNLGAAVAGIGRVFRSPAFWRVAPITVMSQAGLMSVQGLWAGPWLRDVAGLAPADVAHHLLFAAAAMMAGSIALGALADRLGRRGISPTQVGLVSMALFMGVQATLAYGWLPAGQAPWPLVQWMAFAFFGSAGILPYAGLSQRFPADLSGRVITGMNLMVFLSAFSLQWLIGVIIGLWPHGADGTYAVDAYAYALSLPLATQGLAFVWYLAHRDDRLFADGPA